MMTILCFLLTQLILSFLTNDFILTTLEDLLFCSKRISISLLLSFGILLLVMSFYVFIFKCRLMAANGLARCNVVECAEIFDRLGD